jgi:hypothetical protein
MVLASLGLAATLGVACSATSKSSTFGDGAAGSGGEGPTGTAGGTQGGGGESTTIAVDAGSDGAAPKPLVAQVFAHSANTLYELDPDTKAVSVVGDFQGCSSVIDLAIDKDGVVFATTFDGLYRVDPKTAKCSFVASGSYPNSLSFVPAGTLDPAAEALVGYVGGDYVRIDTASGAVTTVGSLGGGYESSGDVVSVIGGGTYLTVKGNDCSDCIVEVDPKSGAMKKMIGKLDHSSVFGLAFWGGVAYGFDDSGTLFQIDLSSAKTTLIPMPGAPEGLSFWGAGSTTAAPLTPPK